MQKSPAQVADLGPFANRHIGPSDKDVASMLKVIDAPSLDALVSETIPAPILEDKPLGLGAGLSERDALARLQAMAGKNQVFTSMIGQGYYGTITPPVILRNVLENPAWYTAYTPYQPEISQGRLEALFNYQTLACELTGLDIANASLLDEATAVAEAMSLAKRSATSKSSTFFVDEDCHPQTISVLRTRAEPLGWSLVVGDPSVDLVPSEVFGAVFQYPGSSGRIRDLRRPIAGLHQEGSVAVVAADPMALLCLTPPGVLGADIAVGSFQRFGVPMGFGGPHPAYIAVRDNLKRSLPGRLVSQSVDGRGKPAYRLALQTREQHIRREKATSNICTAQALLAVIASMYAVYHGPEGLLAIARSINEKAVTLAAGLKARGFQILTSSVFDTFVVETGHLTDEIVARSVQERFNFRRIGHDRLGISVDETTSEGQIRKVWDIFGPDRRGSELSQVDTSEFNIPQALRRSDRFLSQEVFNRYHSETEMLRYLRRLADRDLALDRTMIPLGSCTMKLNATAEMIPVTWPEFADMHPYAPTYQVLGYQELFHDLRNRLCTISGYDAISLQPNSGAQGEFAGLMAIRAYHRSRGEGSRTICLIPASAHGTNPASAHMAGMEVVVVNCDEDGNVDLGDLDAKICRHADRIAAIMITYPSTHGVFEESIQEICDRIHAVGGQVYLDGANLNAQVCLARPGRYGADVSHFNLHKTFCIPHGGGGPGMGPIGVRAHLAPFLPGRPEIGEAGAVSAAEFGSASILPISYMYMVLMGEAGLRRATEVAILNANYIAARLSGSYPILYRGTNGRVAHECIIDLRPMREETGVTVDDVAKRLIDFGIHAPTMSFPVPGTFMIEPTESESLSEIDRFCDAMITIRSEIEAIRLKQLTVEVSPLRNAPHTVHDLVEGRWHRQYSRKQATYPDGAVNPDKYWSPVNRIDNAYGDRNLICSCPPVADISLKDDEEAVLEPV
jgi:glycine dehydrogenase